MDTPISSGHDHVLVLPSQTGALEPQCPTQNLLDIIRDLNRGFSGAAGELRGELIQECDLVRGPRIHEHEIRVEKFVSSDGGSVKHALFGVNGDRHDPVRDAADFPAERHGRDHGVEDGAVVADEEDAGIIPTGIHRNVKRATRGVGLCTRRPSWKMTGLRRCFVGNGSDLNGGLFVISDENAGFLHKPSGTPGFHIQFRSKNHIGAEKVLSKVLHHNPRIGSDNIPFPARIEHLPSLRINILGVKLGQHGPGHDLNVFDLEPREGDEDEGLNSHGFRHEYVKEVDKWDRH
nr:hypothetical protein Ccrd_016079 [Ipomoea batatas]